MTAGDTTTHHRIVVGVDGSEPSVQALRWAARLAATLSVGIEAVTSWSWPVTYGTGGVVATWNPEVDAKTTQDDAISRAFPGTEPAGLHRTVREGHAARVLLDTAEGATMLVVGSRGHGGFVGLLIGSVSAHVAEHAHCPVLVIHDGQHTVTS